MLPWQTWMFPVAVPMGEAVKPEAPQPERERLVLVCLPPGQTIQEGDRVLVSDPRCLDRPPQASQMPQEVLTVPDSPRLLLPEELGFAVEFRLARHRARQPSEAQRALEEDLLAAFA